MSDKEIVAIVDVLKGQEVTEMTLAMANPKAPFFDMKLEESIGNKTKLTLWAEPTTLKTYNFTVGEYVNISIIVANKTVSDIFVCTKTIKTPLKTEFIFESISYFWRTPHIIIYI